MRRTRVLIADPLTIFRSGVRSLLSREGDFEVTEAANLEELTRLAREAPPDIALVDLDLPPLGGVAAVARLSECSDASAIVWSFDPTRDTVLAAVRAGARGYLHKYISPAGLLRSLRGTVRGEAPLSRDLATLMIDALHGLDERDRIRERAAGLSEREREVLDHVGRGASNKEIAGALVISEFTVKRHMQNILRKLEVPSRRAAAAFYRAAFESDEPVAREARTA